MNTIINNKIKWIKLGHIDYQKAWNQQEKLFESIVKTKINNRSSKNISKTKNYILSCSHPHVYTLGRSGDENNLLIDKDSYVVKLDGNEVFFPKKEFELLHFLATNPKKVFSRESLLRNIWGADVHVVARTVDVHIRKIREKLGQDFISTIKGVGYKFKN